jgi:hypothetical protein
VDEILQNNGFSAWWQALKVDSDNADADGKYFMGIDPEQWLQELIKDLG